MATVIPQQAQYSFIVEQRGTAQVFTYQKAKYSLTTVFLGMATFAFLSLIPAMIWGAAAWAFLTFVLPIILYYVLNALRKDGTFTITPDSVEVDGNSYSRAHIHHIFIKVPYDNEQLVHIETRRSGGFVISGDRPHQIGMGAAVAVTQGVGAAVETAGQISNAAARGLKKQFIKRNHKIGFVYGEKKILLASGLAEKTSPVLLSRIEQVLENK